MAEPSLELLMSLMERVLSELGDIKADMAVLTALVMRIDRTQGGFLEELRALHGQHGRLDRRVRALEEAGHPPA